MSLPSHGYDEELLDYRDRRQANARESIARALEACRDALAKDLESNTVELADKPGESWRRSVAAFAAFASQQNVPPERALAAFKRMVAELSVVQRLPFDERNDTVRRLVQAAIEAYYDR